MPAYGQSTGTAGEVTGQGDTPGASSIPPARDQPPGWNFGAITRSGGEIPASDAPIDATTRFDLGWPELGEGYDNADDRYVPPHVPPQPKLDPVARGAGTAIVGGPGYLFIATTLSWQISGWAAFAAITAFVAGFVVLVARLGDGPSRRDGPDQGAVV